MESTKSTSPRVLRPLWLRLLAWTGKLCFLLVLLLSFVIGFGSTSKVQTDLSVFTDASQRWQQHPEFRTVASEYVTFGSRAMQTRPLGITSSDWIIWIRSLPIMPKNFALNDTSRAHYFNFSQGPLSAYLYLCYEQDLSDDQGNGYYLHEMEQLCLEGVPTDGPADPRFQKVLGWLRDKMKVDGNTVAHDAGAQRSLIALLRDTYPTPQNRFKTRPRHADKLLRQQALQLGRDLGFVSSTAAIPENQELPTLQALTFAQQQSILERLDRYVHEKDPELWRAKQVSDFMGGIWAQVYGPPYKLLLEPYVHVVSACRWIFVVLLGAWMVVQWRKHRVRTQPDVQAVDTVAAELSEAQGKPVKPH